MVTTVGRALGARRSLRSELDRSRFDVPGMSEHHVRRPRLLRRLDAGAGLALTLVSAPVGSGKTTLLAEWAAERRPQEVAWLACQPGDDTSERFWPLVSEALSRSRPGRLPRVTTWGQETIRDSLIELSAALAALQDGVT